MFIYEDSDRNICATFNDSKPVINPEYIISINEDEQYILFNGCKVPKLVNTVFDTDVEFETAKTIDQPVHVINNGVISAPNDTAGDGIYHVTLGGSLIIDGTGTINSVGNNDYNMAIWADGGNVIINGGTFTNKGATATVDPAHFDLIYVKNGSIVEINDGYFECETPKWTLNLNDSNPGTIVVKGGTFVNYDPSKSETEPGGVRNFVAPGYKVVSSNNIFTVVKA